MRAFLRLLLFIPLLLPGCGRPIASQEAPALPQTTPALPEALDTLQASPSPDTHPPTPIPCDEATGFCVEVFGLLGRPIGPQGTQRVDPGYRYGSTLGGSRPAHHGVEFYNASGTPVLAAGAGRVVYAGDDSGTPFSPWLDFYGNLVLIEHFTHDPALPILYSLYAHLSRIQVAQGEQVTAGQVIGAVGASGSANGSHLHFEVRSEADDYDSSLNPELFLLPAPDGRPTGVLVLTFLDRNGNRVAAQPNVQFFPRVDAPPAAAYQPETYAEAGMSQRSPWGENAVLGDLLPGEYRVSVLYTGTLYERRVRIEPGRMTRLSFQFP